MVKTDIDKTGRFKKVASRRTDEVLRALQSLSKCSNKRSYEYTQSQINRIFKAIKAELKTCQAAFDSTSHHKQGFKL